MFLAIHGSKSHSGQIVLERTPGSFQPGSVDVFMLKLPDMGELKDIIIGHDARVCARVCERDKGSCTLTSGMDMLKGPPLGNSVKAGLKL